VSCAGHDVLLSALRAAAGDRDFVVVSEWLGYLPFGQYVWIEVDGVEVSAGWPPWDSGAIEALVTAGRLVVVERRVTSEDGVDSRTTLRFR
jgi:hypothetical protein